MAINSCISITQSLDCTNVETSEVCPFLFLLLFLSLSLTVTHSASLSVSLFLSLLPADVFRDRPSVVLVPTEMHQATEESLPVKAQGNLSEARKLTAKPIHKPKK